MHLEHIAPLLGDLGVPRLETLAHLLGRERPTLPLATRDHDTGCSHADDAGQPDDLPPLHGFTVATRDTARMNAASLSLDAAVEITRTGDLWLFRGHSAADRAIRTLTNAPVNHVGMAVVLEDMPPLMWHAELGQSLLDMWTGKHQRGVQLHDLRDAALVWANRYGQQGWLRQLDGTISREAEDALLKAIARLDGTPFPTTRALAAGWFGGRLPKRGVPAVDHGWPAKPAPFMDGGRGGGRETAYCAEVVAITYQDMGLLTKERHASWFDPGKFWSGDDLELSGGFRLSEEIRLDIPNDAPKTGRPATS